ncbi:hypothetical protein IV203_032270 [Nitzschia inconspicua]|uniref:Uncharacterized protein n=1 Tax=Nitzschia inconspicua TaxID=303405 RepID=A0A9K3KKG3_9STRA|nr:hypothetical protein IV203_032270 [Nitzschia inconspicua]
MGFSALSSGASFEVARFYDVTLVDSTKVAFVELTVGKTAAVAMENLIAEANGEIDLLVLRVYCDSDTRDEKRTESETSGWVFTVNCVYSP